MATLREVRARISGVKKIQKITKAMKMVAAAKLRRTQSNVLAARPYARKIKELLQHLSANAEFGLHPLLVPREVRAVALVVVTSDRGLCGAFNANLVKATVNRITTQYAEIERQGKLRLFCIGRKGADFFSKHKYAIAGKYIGIYQNLVFARAHAIAQDIVEGYLKGTYDRVEIIYNEFKSISQQRIAADQFLPVPPESMGTDTQGVASPVYYIYEPSNLEIARLMVPKHVDFQLWRVLLESSAAEEGARMVAMDNATENANELISALQLLYNKARQASITKELLEVVSGAEALKESA
jgi:F-type H+-transporting ATPase subunit gamma